MRRCRSSTNVAGAPDGREETMMNTRSRVGAAFCVLFLALIFGGFGQSVATADTETGSSVGGTQAPANKGDDAGKTEAGKTEAGKTEPGKTEPGNTEAPKTEAAPTEGAPPTGSVDTLPEFLAALDTE